MFHSSSLRKEVSSNLHITNSEFKNSALSEVCLPLSNGGKIVLSHTFIEWFIGFTDAEGCFAIVKDNRKKFCKLFFPVYNSFTY